LVFFFARFLPDGSGVFLKSRFLSYSLSFFVAIGPREDDIFTIGHSTHSLEELVSLLRGQGVSAVVDVRMYPRSRRMPHFNSDALETSLPSHGISYLHLPALGGRRSPAPDSPNGGWREEQFRGYADHMESDEFQTGLSRLEELARSSPAAVMCAEALWWRCHRRLVSDALLVRGWRVLHIGPDGGTSEHELTPFAVVDGERLVYPPEQTAFDI
jgi:uncharacterized protein (DUF488 family)